MGNYIDIKEYNILKKFSKYSPSVFYAMTNYFIINKHVSDKVNNIPYNLEVESFFEHNMLQYLTMKHQVGYAGYSKNYSSFHNAYKNYIIYIRDNKMILEKASLNSLQYLQVDSIRNADMQVLLIYIHLNFVIITKLGNIENNISIEDYSRFFKLFLEIDSYWEDDNIKKGVMPNWNKLEISKFETVFSASSDIIVDLYKTSNRENNVIVTDVSNRYPLVEIDGKLIPLVRSYKAIKYSLLYYYGDTLHDDKYSKIGIIYEEHICDALSRDINLEPIDKKELFHKSSGIELYDYVLYDNELLICFEIKFNLTKIKSKFYEGRNEKIFEAALQLKNKKKIGLFNVKFPHLKELKKYNVCISFEEYHYTNEIPEEIVLLNPEGILLLNTEEVLDIIFRYKGGFKGYVTDVKNRVIENKDIIPDSNKLSNDQLFEYLKFEFLNEE